MIPMILIGSCALSSLWVPKMEKYYSHLNEIKLEDATDLLLLQWNYEPHQYDVELDDRER